MRVMYERCCGLDIHKASIAACALVTEKGKTQEQTRRFGTMTADLRDLTRTRAILTQERSSICNRIQKVLEDANIKLGSVASDVFGVSGRAILRALMNEEKDAEALADLSKGTLRNKIPQLRRALE